MKTFYFKISGRVKYIVSAVNGNEANQAVTAFLQKNAVNDPNWPQNYSTHSVLVGQVVDIDGVSIGTQPPAPLPPAEPTEANVTSKKRGS